MSVGVCYSTNWNLYNSSQIVTIIVKDNFYQTKESKDCTDTNYFNYGLLTRMLFFVYYQKNQIGY